MVEAIVRRVLARFCARHPGAIVEVLIDYGLRDIVADRLDAGIRLGQNVERDMIAVALGPELRMAAVASPAYFALHPAPETPADPTRHRSINYRMMASGSLYAWEFERDGRELDVKVDGPLTFDEPALMLGAALQGLGIAYVLEDQAEPLLAEGRLVASAGGVDASVSGLLPLLPVPPADASGPHRADRGAPPTAGVLIEIPDSRHRRREL